MSNYSYSNFAEQARNGKILVGVEPSVARKFFIDANHLTVKEEIGESLFIQRFFVKTVFYLDYLCIFAGVIACIFALKWYSIIIIPVMLIISFVLGGRASIGGQKIGGAISLMVVFMFIAYHFKDSGISTVVWIILLPLPYFFTRLTYKLATVFLRSLSIRNEKVFNVFNNKGIFLKEI